MASDHLPHMTDETDLFADLAERLRSAQQRLGRADLDGPTKESLQQRLIVITNSAKHDLATASRRLNSLIAELPEIP
ncbi:MAG: hypothetical protein QOE64_1675 [Frankiales bacterium]|nr:hypothetical protein [Frankiales bacterium]